MNDMIFVTDIRWERIFLHLTLETHISKPIKEFRLRSGRRKIITPPVDAEKTGENTYELTVNMSAANGRQFLENGNWNVVAYQEGDTIDMTDGIMPIVVEEPERMQTSNTWMGLFNMAGQRMNKGLYDKGLPKGVYIINGKKVVRK